MKQKIFDWIYRSLRKIGATESGTVSSKSLMEKIGAIAEDINQDYYSLYIEINSKRGVKFRGYINDGPNCGTHASFDDVIKDLENRPPYYPQEPVEEIYF